MPVHENTFQIHYEEALNPSQLDAVTYTRGPLLIIAGAGSGKTRTLTYRVARLVEEGVHPGSILLLTFTRKAASEMLKRASDLLDRRCENVAGGTFHSFANLTLRRYAAALGFNSGFSIIDRPDTESLISLLRKEFGYGTQFRSFPKKQTLANIFSRAVNKSMPVEDVILDAYPHFEPFLDEIVTLNNAYGKQKADQSFLDFDDLLIYLKRLLADHPDIRQRLCLQYRYLMVDEFQDTNQIQANIVYLLSGDEKNVMVVGDDSQSIYAFRGANFKNIIDFPKRYEGTKIVRLEENYRSVQPILELANVVIDRAAEKYTKTLFTRRTGGALPTLVAAADEHHQSQFVVNTVKSLKESGVPLEQLTVLFRASFHAFDLEIELGKHGFPFIKVGGFKFMESAHIKDVLAYLRVLLNPIDRISWNRILLLMESVGPRTAQKIYDTIVKEPTAALGLDAVSPQKRFADAFERLKRLFAGLNPQDMSVARLGESVLQHYIPILEERYDDYPKRAKDLEQLISIMVRYPHLEQFLTDMTLDPPNSSTDDGVYTDFSPAPRMTLSTIHSAKGLEWHTVFIIWALDGRFPSVYSLDKSEDLEEELRLMYVAATRAKENLFIIYPMQAYDRGSGMTFCQPSRFVDGIPETVLQRQAVGTNSAVYRQDDYYYDDFYSGP